MVVSDMTCELANDRCADPRNAAVLKVTYIQPHSSIRQPRVSESYPWERDSHVIYRVCSNGVNTWYFAPSYAVENDWKRFNGVLELVIW